MDTDGFPAEDQMVTTVTVRDGDTYALKGTTVLATAHRVVVRCDVSAAERMPVKGQIVTLLYSGACVMRLKCAVNEVIEGLKLLLEPLGPATEGERREFLRTSADVKLYAEVVGPDYRLPGETEPFEVPSWTDIELDLSGSGIKFLWNSPCRGGDLMFVRMVLPTPQSSVVNAIGEVVRANPDAASGKLDVALHFTSMTETDQDLIINYVFRKYYEALGLGA